MRIGHGFDAHVFEPGRRLILGGVEIAHTRGLSGHSDADVAVHAVIDAMLGAAAAGDVGLLFPSSDPEWKDCSSLDMLVRTNEVVRSRGYVVSNVDTTIVAQEPRIAPWVAAMRQAIASAVGLDVDRVSVKATTSDGMGFTGRGEGIAAFALVLLE
jgi:2-C-methyl-D-erythritol 2,4-cyclodiphosphate synthase